MGANIVGYFMYLTLYLFIYAMHFIYCALSGHFTMFNVCHVLIQSFRLPNKALVTYFLYSPVTSHFRIVPEWKPCDLWTVPCCSPPNACALFVRWGAACSARKFWKCQNFGSEWFVSGAFGADQYSATLGNHSETTRKPFWNHSQPNNTRKLNGNRSRPFGIARILICMPFGNRTAYDRRQVVFKWKQNDIRTISYVSLHLETILKPLWHHSQTLGAE